MTLAAQVLELPDAAGRGAARVAHAGARGPSPAPHRPALHLGAATEDAVSPLPLLLGAAPRRARCAPRAGLRRAGRGGARSRARRRGCSHRVRRVALAPAPARALWPRPRGPALVLAARAEARGAPTLDGQHAAAGAGNAAPSGGAAAAPAVAREERGVQTSPAGCSAARVRRAARPRCFAGESGAARGRGDVCTHPNGGGRGARN